MNILNSLSSVRLLMCYLQRENSIMDLDIFKHISLEIKEVVYGNLPLADKRLFVYEYLCNTLDRYKKLVSESEFVSKDECSVIFLLIADLYKYKIFDSAQIDMIEEKLVSIYN